MILCDFHPLANGRFYCPACDPEGKRTVPVKSRRPCDLVVLRSEAEQARLAAICRTNACGAFDTLRDACRRCACESQRHAAWLAKLRVGRCPAGQWPK
jgi:hypothetical protein